MNVALKIAARSDAATVEHSVMAYDRNTDALVGEWPIPRCLDSLALEIARVSPEDAAGAASYPLNDRQLGEFGFLLGVEALLGPSDGIGMESAVLSAAGCLRGLLVRPVYGEIDEDGDRPRISQDGRRVIQAIRV